MKRVEGYELAWAEALAVEHTHQRELLAALHNELGTFAGECAAALTALDAIVDLGAVVGLLDVATTGSRDAALVRDIAQRLPGLARTDALRDEQLSGFYTHVGGETDMPQAVVHQAGELLRADRERTDAVLLRAIIDGAGERSVIRHVAGPASVAALHALGPLAHWAPALARLGKGEGGRGELVAAAHKDLTTVLQSMANAAGTTLAADSIALADSLRDTVEHIEAAARAITTGKLEQAIAEARAQLEADLARLHAVHDKAPHAPHTWHAARRLEHAALTEEVHEKLEKVEKIRRALGLILPHLQITARALATIEKLRSVEGRIDGHSASGVKAARMSLLLAAAEASQASLPESRHAVNPPRPLPRRWLVGAALVLIAAGVATALSLTGGSKKAAKPNTILNVTPSKGIPTAPTLTPVHATFDPAQRATFYAVAARATSQGKASYTWRLTPPKDNPGCNKFGSVIGSPNRAVWHHADTDGCAHTGTQHLGTVPVTITTLFWKCTTSFFGTLTATGDPPRACTRV